MNMSDDAAGMNLSVEPKGRYTTTWAAIKHQWLALSGSEASGVTCCEILRNFKKKER